LGLVTGIAGHLRLAALTPVALSLAFSTLLEQGKGRRSLHLAYGYLSACLNRAVDLDLISANPMTKVRRPRWTPKPRIYWSVEETTAFLVACRRPYLWGPLFITLVTTGLRISEALALTWDDIEGNTLSVIRSLVWAGQEVTVQQPKTRAGRRSLSLPTSTVVALKRQREQQPDNPGGAVFRSSTGAVPQLGHIRDMLDDMCKRAGVPRLNPHGLRHVHAMLALEATRDPYLVQRRLGHASVSTTLGIYGYSRQDDSRINAALDDLIGG